MARKHFVISLFSLLTVIASAESRQVSAAVGTGVIYPRVS